MNVECWTNIQENISAFFQVFVVGIFMKKVFTVKSNALGRLKLRPVCKIFSI